MSTSQLDPNPQAQQTPPAAPAAPAAPPADAPAVPEAVVKAEETVLDHTPTDLKASAEQVATAFNEFEQEEAAKATAAVPAEEAAQAAKDPALVETAKELKVADFGGVVNSFPALTKEVKAGYKTTEFWLTAAGVVLTQLGTLHLPGKYGDTFTTMALLGSYVLSRGIAKAG